MTTAAMLKSRGHHTSRRLPIGAEVLPDGRVSFRVWAPKAKRMHVVLATDSKSQPTEELRLQEEGDGHFSLLTDRAKVGMCYGFKLDRGQRILPDPASRFQPDGPAGLSQIVDPRSFQWSDEDWKGVGPRGQVIYEMHVGTFTKEGTYAAIVQQFAELARIGITMIELMPVADFPGRFGWGYDGVSMFAPTRLYGQPDDLRRFVDEAHRAGLAVILDVVYNHFGNVDNYLGEFSDNFRSKRYKNEWAAAINFDDADSKPVREFFEANARYWIEEFHFDGYRYDATHAIHDASQDHILAAINRVARKTAGERGIYLVAENAIGEARTVRPASEGGFDMNAVWNDDFHHAARVRVTGSNAGYYSDYNGSPEELAAALKHGFIYQGQWAVWTHHARGTPTTGLPATAFVNFIQNHDQVSNSQTGQRVHELTSPGRYRAITALWLLAPQTPLFFQGQEFAASTPFLYFADYSGDMAKAVRRGRAEFLSQFPASSTPEAKRELADPCDLATMERCILDFTERNKHRPIYDLHIDLLKLRREDPVFRQERSEALETAILSPDCLAVRYQGAGDDARLLLANFGSDLHLKILSQPLLAPPPDSEWELLWHSNALPYGGPGVVPIEAEEGWTIAGESTMVLQPKAKKK
jgi:maltooligosyltrehalose trehalohydrolase